MAPFTNQGGEVSPDSTRVRVFVETKAGRATIKSVEAANSSQVMESITFSGVVNQYIVTPGAQVLNFISPNIDEQPANFDAAISVTRIPHEVIFLDVGRWGGPKKFGPRQRNFGLVWGPWVALCDYEPHNPALDTDANLITDDKGPQPVQPINDFIREVRKAGSSVRLLRYLWAGNPNYLKGWTDDWETLYVILPDLHLPVCTSKPNSSDGHHMGRHKFLEMDDKTGQKPDQNGMIGSPGDPSRQRFATGANRWFDNYLEGDIFGGPDEAAATDLYRFIDIIEGMTLPPGRKMHFVQIGDMYDMWIGLERFYSQQATQSVVLANGTGEQSGILAGTFIDTWASKTHWAFEFGKAKQNVVDRLNLLAQSAKLKTSWLWGNHDNYLAVHTPTGVAGPPVPPRVRKVEAGGTLIEHGQRGDPKNCDGSVDGHKTTNDVFDTPVIRQFDPNRRNYYTALAGATYVANPTFRVFVMGHTHSPYLTRVQIETTLMKPSK